MGSSQAKSQTCGFPLISASPSALRGHWGASQDGRVCVSYGIKGSQAFRLVLLFTLLSLLFFTPKVLPDFSYMTCQQFSWIARVSTHNPLASIIFLNKVPFLQLLPL